MIPQPPPFPLPQPGPAGEATGRATRGGQRGARGRRAHHGPAVRALQPWVAHRHAGCRGSQARPARPAAVHVAARARAGGQEHVRANPPTRRRSPSFSALTPPSTQRPSTRSPTRNPEEESASHAYTLRGVCEGHGEVRSLCDATVAPLHVRRTLCWFSFASSKLTRLT